MLSVFSTLGEALRLGARHFALLGILATLAAIPEMAPVAFGFDKIQLHHFAIEAPVAFGTLIMNLIVSSAKTAAILGVLKDSSSQSALVLSVAENVRAYTGTLIRLSLLLMLIAFLAWMPLGLFIVMPLAAMHAIFAKQLIVILVAIVYLMFLKFALANPLVVVENMLARDAVQKSWEMTKGRFWYVLGCYAFLGAAQYLIVQVAAFAEPESSPIFIKLANSVISNFLDSFWILTGWCMYQRIKTVTNQIVVDATLYPPNSPSASQGV